MGRNKKVKTYSPEAFAAFGKYLELLRQQGTRKFFRTKVNLEGLEKALYELPKEDRENVEKFWGLTGGTNHSKKLTSYGAKDVAFIEMRDKASRGISKLSRLDFARMYDDTVDSLVEKVNRKLNKSGCPEVSGLDAAKYMLAFFMIVENGPKMSYERNLMEVKTNIDKTCYIDEYDALNKMWSMLRGHHDHSINFGIVKNTFEMMDVRDYASIQKSFGIKVEEGTDSKELEVLDTLAKIRCFKERVFEYGPWDMTQKLVMGSDIKLEMFVEELSKLWRDWSKMTKFKTAEKDLKTSTETRVLKVYKIGELEFTDPYEVMCLYLARNFIPTKLFVA